jgi:putative ABC transport system permease protein
MVGIEFTTMFRNYLKTALRNLLREKSSTFINLAGLTLGITCSIILFLIIDYHKSFDTFHSRRDRIYRIVHSSEGNNGKEYQSGVPSVLPDAFRLDFPEVEEVIFTTYRSETLVLVPQKNEASKKFLEETGVVYTEPGFFRIFDRKMLQGNGVAGLDEPNEAIISKSWATRYFGTDDVIGEIIKTDNHEFKIAAVMEDAPSNSDLPFNLMLSYITIEKETEAHGWNSIWSDEHCYFLLRQGEDIGKVQSRLPAFTKKHNPDAETNKAEFMVQPFTDLHFDDRFDTYNYRTVSTSMLTTFGVIAAILLLTACINFINLATAEAVKRSKEVGIRKTLGGTRYQLVFQFLGETVMITVVAVILSLGLTQIVLGFLNPFLDLNLRLAVQSNLNLTLFLLGVTLMVALLSGLYPAFVMSGFKPALALKNKMTNRNSSGYFLRSGLVVVQFFISQFFIIGTIVLIKQTNYVHEKDLGFSKDAILIVPIPNDGSDEETAIQKKKTLRTEAARIPGVEMVSLGSTPPSSGSMSKTGFTIEGDAKEYVTQIKQVDQNYIDIYSLKLIGGSKLSDLDSANGFVVNETFARTVGYQTPQEIVGKSIRLWDRELPIVGVLKDFHTISLEQEIEATVLFNNVNNYRTLALKVNLNNIPQVVKELKTHWEQMYPEQLFDYQFLDESIREFYEGERKMATLLSVFTSMAIFIGCLGLFGLATFMANQKTKEIGVRKVLGASVESIVFSFSSEYAKLISIGFLIAAPLAGFAMQQFLDQFAYRIELGAGIYFLSLIITLLVALLTVGYRSFRAAVANPVNSLRYE